MAATHDGNNGNSSSNNSNQHPDVLDALIVGSGFGGIGMAIMLLREGITHFLIIERAAAIGGTWRDNDYPGAACDVPSHLYSFSFEPNPDWSSTFAAQPEIQRYLQHCADKYHVMPHVRLNTELRAARFDETASVWVATLADGGELKARHLITATGLLNRPVLPDIEGLPDFRGKAFHSAQWDHGHALAGRSVAVIGTGASAAQFVPEIAKEAASLAVFQRTPSYLIRRNDRPYASWVKRLFRALPALMLVERARFYAFYEARALAFTRFHGLMVPAVGWPFRRMLHAQLKDDRLRRQLTPSHQIGCKRILLSNDYLATMARPNVSLHTTPIARITVDGVQTSDGQVHVADTLIFGTGFAATEFLTPLSISGRHGRKLNEAWRNGAAAYLGITVPGFPNFFMLYGPNTNLGHNSIIYMLESQAQHVVRCLREARKFGANCIEVRDDVYRRFAGSVRQRLSSSIWAKCSSWYRDASGNIPTNWPGFTFSYRWLARYASLDAYRFERVAAVDGFEGSGEALAHYLPPPRSLFERATAAFLRVFLRLVFRSLIGPPQSARVQRFVVNMLGPLMPGCLGVTRTRQMLNDLAVEIVKPAGRHGDKVILYLHGGAFCLGSPQSHRSITTRLAAASRCDVWVPDYRLAPEHPYPAALEDAIYCYQILLARGHDADNIIVAGDSAGGALALALMLTLRDKGVRQPGKLMLISTVADIDRLDQKIMENAVIDPMLRSGWLQQAMGWYACTKDATSHRPLDADLSKFPPMLLQVGDQEILLQDTLRLAAHAKRFGNQVTLQVYGERWHDFHLQAAMLKSARQAIRELAAFAVS